MPKLPLSGLDRNRIDSITKDIINKCNLIEPRNIPIIENITYKEKDFIVLWCPGGADRPYKCPSFITKDKSRKPEMIHYIRKGSSTIRANTQDEKRLFELSEDVPFYDRINYNAQIEDIKYDLVKDFLYSVDSKLYDRFRNIEGEDVLESMHLITGPVEMKKPLNIALMFFNDHPEDFFPYAYIEIVTKPDPTGTDMEEMVFKGPLHIQLKNALRHIGNMVVTAPLGEPRGFHGVSMVHFLLHAPSSCILYNNCFLIESGLGNDAGNRAGGHQCTLLDLLEFYSDQSSTGCGRGIISVPFWKLWRGRRPMGLCMCQCGYSTTRGGSRIPRCGLRPRPVHLRGRWRSARTSAGPAHGLLYARRSMLGRLHGTGRHRQGRRAPWQGHGSRGCCAGLTSSGSPHVPRPRLMTAPRKDASHQDAPLPAVGQCQGRRRVPRGLSSYSPPLQASGTAFPGKGKSSRRGRGCHVRAWRPRRRTGCPSESVRDAHEILHQALEVHI